MAQPYRVKNIWRVQSRGTLALSDKMSKIAGLKLEALWPMYNLFLRNTAMTYASPK